jgi:hypothetical protein
VLEVKLPSNLYLPRAGGAIVLTDLRRRIAKIGIGDVIVRL